MFKPILKLLKVLDKDQLRQFWSLQILVFFSSISELAGIASITPFMTLASNPEILSQEGHLLYQLYQFSGVGSEQQFLILLAVGCFLFLLIATVFSLVVVWRISLFATSIGVGIGDRLFNYYLHQSYQFHVKRNSAELTRRISMDTQLVSYNFILPILQFTSKLLPSLLIIVSLLIIDFTITLSGFLIIGSCYAILVYAIRQAILVRGRLISDSQGNRFKLMSEGLGAIKDVLILSRSKIFVDRFQDSGVVLAKSQGENQVFAQAPRYILELIAVGSILLLIMFMLLSRGGSITSALPILSLYAVAGFKLLPNFQMIYSAFARIRGSLGVFENIYPDLVELRKEELLLEQSKSEFQEMTSKASSVDFSKEISLRNIWFSYDEKDRYALKATNLTIPKNSSIGLVGPSGSGKSTIIDILLGLLKVEKGEIIIDGFAVDPIDYKAFVSLIAYVPQVIYLTDDTIRNNIAFGLPPQDIDDTMVIKACELACLEEFLDSLDNGLDTIVGERGIQLSGGQRQRIGIARAMYNNAEILILDEATSALDNMTERAFMRSINAFEGEKTIVMVAHRLTTVEHCDIIYYIEDGRIIDKGSYNYLIDNNERFREMAYA